MRRTAGRGFGCAFLGVKGSPVQIRPSRLVRGWFRVSAASFWLQWERTCAPIHSAGQAEWRALPCKHPDQRLLALSASACWFPPFPAASGELPPGQGVAGSDPAVKGWFWATTAAEGRRRPPATTLSRLGPRRPATSTAPAFRCSLPPPTVSTPICQLVAIQPQLRLSPTVTISTGWHPYARRQIEYALSVGGEFSWTERRRTARVLGGAQPRERRAGHHATRPKCGGHLAGSGRPARGRRGQGIKTSFPRTWPPRLMR
jgi:hypothetical protein